MFVHNVIGCSITKSTNRNWNSKVLLHQIQLLVLPLIHLHIQSLVAQSIFKTSSFQQFINLRTCTFIKHLCFTVSSSHVKLTLKVMMRCVKWNSASRFSWMVTFSRPAGSRTLDSCTNRILREHKKPLIGTVMSCPIRMPSTHPPSLKKPFMPSWRCLLWMRVLARWLQLSTTKMAAAHVTPTRSAMGEGRFKHGLWQTKNLYVGGQIKTRDGWYQVKLQRLID